MHCPKCGHQQASDEQKFCSKCGFETELVRGFLTDEKQAGDQSEDAIAGGFWTRRNGMFISFIVMIMSVMTGATLKAFGMREMAGLIAVFGMCIGMIGVVVSNFYLQPGGRSKLRPKSGKSELSGGIAKQLSEQSGMAVDDVIRPGDWRTPTTNELIQPPSITEPTTKLLQKDL